MIASRTVPAEEFQGYTVFDLTEIDTPRYCFFLEGQSEVLGPAKYLEYAVALPDLASGPAHSRPRDYGSDRGDSTNDMEYLHSFQLISFDALRATWPQDFDTAEAVALAAKSRDDEAANSELSLAALSIRSLIQDLLTSDEPATSEVLDPVIETLLKPQNISYANTELSHVATLNHNGILLLKALLSAQNSAYVNLVPWLARGALPADALDLLADGLQHSEILNISGSSDLTTDHLQTLVLKLPSLKHVIALGCPAVGRLTMRLPISSYLESKELERAAYHGRLFDGGLNYPDCARWVDPASDAPAGLTLLIFSRVLRSYAKSGEMRRYGLELAHFSAEGVTRGLAWLVRFLYESPFMAVEGQPFAFRAAFQVVGAQQRACLPSIVGRPATSRWEKTRAEPEDMQPAPRHPGWTLALDTRGSAPDSRSRIFERLREQKRDDAPLRPRYAFVRWDWTSNAAGRALVPVEALDLRGWVAQLPLGHGTVGEDVLLEFDEVFARQKVSLMSLADAQTAGVWSSETWDLLRAVGA